MNGENNTQKDIGGKLKVRLIGLKYNALKDYISARVLFNASCLREACILANQCLEKEMKTYIEARNGKQYGHHNTSNLLNVISRMKPEVAENINRDFISVLNKAYTSRYYEKLQPGFSVTIVKNKFLAELDQIFHYLQALTIMRDPKNTNTTTHYQHLVNVKSPLLYTNNHILNKIPKDKFLRQQDLVEDFCMYVIDDCFILTTSLAYSLADNRFIYPPPKVKNDKQLTLFNWNEELRNPQFIQEAVHGELFKVLDIIKTI